MTFYPREKVGGEGERMTTILSAVIPVSAPVLVVLLLVVLCRKVKRQRTAQLVKLIRLVEE